jgi:hypothetical protein
VNDYSKKYFSKNDLIDVVKNIFKEDFKEASYEGNEILTFLEIKLCDLVLELIKFRQSNLKKLKFLDSNKTVAIWNGDYLPSCKICLTDEFVPLRTSTSCQLDCDFCYVKGKIVEPLIKNMYNFMSSNFSEIALKVTLDKQKEFFKGIAWASRGEPLLEIDKIKRMMPYISNLGIYQWMNTNGLLISEDILKILVDCGLNELRFDLQASNFSEDIIKKMELSKKYINNIVVETPIFKKSFENYKKWIQPLYDIGVSHYNMPELQVFPNTILNYMKTEGIFYKHNRGYVSPINSTMYIYDLLDIFEENKIDVTVNICSNSAKFYRGVKSYLRGVISYNTYIQYLPPESYFFIIDNLFKETDNMEIF